MEQTKKESINARRKVLNKRRAEAFYPTLTKGKHKILTEIFDIPLYYTKRDEETDIVLYGEGYNRFPLTVIPIKQAIASHICTYLQNSHENALEGLLQSFIVRGYTDNNTDLMNSLNKFSENIYKPSSSESSVESNPLLHWQDGLRVSYKPSKNSAYTNRNISAEQFVLSKIGEYILQERPELMKDMFTSEEENILTIFKDSSRYDKIDK